MIETTRQHYKQIAILISLVAAGIPIWTRPVRQIDFTDPGFLGIWLLVGTAAAILCLLFINLKTKDLASAFVIGYVTAVVGMFVSGILISNHVHSQLTPALLIAMIIGGLSGSIGPLFWRWIKRR
ncbi:MAG: hypothetical protein ACQER4_06130 [Bacteroidota bacterium]